MSCVCQDMYEVDGVVPGATVIAVVERCVGAFKVALYEGVNQSCSIPT